MFANFIDTVVVHSGVVCATYTKSVIIDVCYIIYNIIYIYIGRLAGTYVGIGPEVLIFRSDVLTLQYILLISRYFYCFYYDF